MTQDIDILIVYASADNQKTLSGKNWAEAFSFILEKSLFKILGYAPTILLQSEYIYYAEKIQKSPKTLLTIISKGFAKSVESMEMMHQVLNYNSANLSVFKVLKEEVSLDEQPHELHHLLSFNFYNVDAETGEAESYNDFDSPENHDDMWLKATNLAFELAKHLSSVEEKQKKEQKTIYLAETSHELTIQRNFIKRELEKGGFKILPNQSLPEDINALKEMVKADIESADLSIHLIGNSYGHTVLGSDRSITDIQHQLATEKSNKLVERNSYSRLIWITPNIDTSHEKQLAFVENIKRDLSSTEGAEIIEVPLEDFRNIIREELIKKQPYSTSKGLHFPDKTNEVKAIYFISDLADHIQADAFKNHLSKAGYEILSSPLTEDLYTNRKKHIQNLVKCDIAIIYKGTASKEWVKMKLLDILKAPGFGRKSIIQQKIILSHSSYEVDILHLLNSPVPVIQIDAVEEAIAELLKLLKQ